MASGRQRGIDRERRVAFSLRAEGFWEGGRHRVADKYEPRLRELAEGYGHTPEPTYEQPIGVRAA